MAEKLTEEQLNKIPKEVLITMFLSVQDQLIELNAKMDSLTEQIAAANNYRFGRHTEKLSDIPGQGTFTADGVVLFNETEAIADQNPDPEEPTAEEVTRKRTPRPKGKKKKTLRVSIQ